MARRTSTLLYGALGLVAGAVLVSVLLGSGRPGAAAAPTTLVTTGPTSPTPTSGPPGPTVPPTTAPVPTVARSTPTTPTTQATPPTTVRYVPVPRRVFVPAPVYTLPLPPTTSTSTTSTTIAAIRGQLPVAPATLPLRTRGTSAHVAPIFSILCGVGILIGVLIMAGRFVITRPNRRLRT